MSNFKDQFVFFIDKSTILRYSLTHHIVEVLPFMEEAGNDRVCSLGDKVYVLSGGYGLGITRIYVLHNPDASISSQEMHWQRIEVPKDIYK